MTCFFPSRFWKRWFQFFPGSFRERFILWLLWNLAIFCLVLWIVLLKKQANELHFFLFGPVCVPVEHSTFDSG